MDNYDSLFIFRMISAELSTNLLYACTDRKQQLKSVPYFQ
jgi:hypothetical protein